MTLLWIDLETTGLDEHKCTILEFAAILTDNQLQPIAVEQMVLHHSGEGLSDFIIDMHTKNGLLAECKQSTNTLEDAERTLRELIEVNCDDKPTLAGSTVHFDHRFLRYHMPALMSRVHYRLFDARTLQCAASWWSGEKFEKANAHRALPDIEESLREVRRIQEDFF